MRCLSEETADLVWRAAALELLECPQYRVGSGSAATYELVPCILQVRNPRRRWILSRYPPYNPAFGIVEVIWIVTGNQESAVLNHWNPLLPRFAGSGASYHGAYGYRLRHAFGFDQVERIYEVLRSAPETRQAVLQLWKPEEDMPLRDGRPVSRDIPCNVSSFLKIRDGKLHWTQVMRSNDIMRGLPYNLIQFTMLQEMMASWIGCEIGEYCHFSDSLHVYQADKQQFSVLPAVSAAGQDMPFRLSYGETQELFEQLYVRIRGVANGRCRETELYVLFARDSAKNKDLCEMVKDMMAAVGSDAARRCGYRDLSYALASACVDADLRNAAVAWLDFRGRTP